MAVLGVWDLCARGQRGCGDSTVTTGSHGDGDVRQSLLATEPLLQAPLGCTDSLSPKAPTVPQQQRHKSPQVPRTCAPGMVHSALALCRAWRQLRASTHPVWVVQGPWWQPPEPRLYMSKARSTGSCS